MKNLLFLLPLIGSVLSAEASDSAKIKYFANAQGVAIAGYDVVAYHTDGKAVAGSEAITALYAGATWQFATAAHRDLFVAHPEKYLPEYGGFCAFAVANMSKEVPSNPDTFRIQDGQLLFFNDLYEGKKFNTLLPWSEKPGAMKEQADVNWKKIHPAQ